MLEPLTHLETQVVDYLEKRLRRDYEVPSTAEICRAIGLGSRGYRINRLLSELEEKGYISRRRNRARSVRLRYTSDGRRFTLGSGVVKIPVLGLIAAGSPIDPQDGFNEFLDLTSDLVGDPTATYALRVTGDSMIGDSVFDGDLVILRQQDTANNGDMVAVWLHQPGETTLKRYYHEGRNVRLRPANPRYPDRIEPEGNVMVQGKVVAVVRQLA